MQRTSDLEELRVETANERGRPEAIVRCMGKLSVVGSERPANRSQEGACPLHTGARRARCTDFPFWLRVNHLIAQWYPDPGRSSQALLEQPHDAR